MGARATEAVAVPWPISISTGTALSVAKFASASSGWLLSGIESTRPSFGLVGVTGGGAAAVTTALRHHWAASGAGGVVAL